MFNIGDRVVVEGNGHLHYSTKEMRNGVVVIEDSMDISGHYGVTLDTGYYVAAKPENIRHYAEVAVYTTPPQKITQNGYEYSLVGPVKPDWLVDGAWVVRKDNGCKHQVVLNKNGLLVLTMPGTDYAILPNRHIYGQYRPHTASDWKWGDWAMYDGKRVFVIGGVDNAGRIFVSYPDIHPLGRNDADRNFLFVPSSKLTPIF